MSNCEISQDARNDNITKVAVIGAGASGLCVLRHFIGDPKYDIVAFEQASALGGVWKYPEGCETFTDVPATSPHYCRIYRDMRTNTPKRITCFPEYPLPEESPTYPPHSVVLQYLRDYTTKFDLERKIKFRHEVTSLTPVETCNPYAPQWIIRTKNLNNDDTQDNIFDAVILCNGHHGVPFLPQLQGIENFKGPVIHSSQYRVPDSYINKRVLIVGGFVSANDILCLLVPFAKKIILSRKHRAEMYADRYPTVLETTSIRSYTSDAAILEDGTIEPVDAVIICTGYQFSFPFVTKDCQLDISRGRVYPLYRHLIHCKFHTMAVVGLLSVVPFLAAGMEAQVKYYKAYLDGKIILPSVEELFDDTDRDYEKRLADGLPAHHAHRMGLRDRTLLWDYVDQLSKDAGFSSYERVIRNVSDENRGRLLTIPCDFRNERHD